MNKVMVIGLTGPIGSGKSVVAKLFCDNGYMLIDADEAARKVVQKGSHVLELLCKEFGDDVINTDGTLNRKTLAQKAFLTKESTKRLNAITHPAILNVVKDQIENFTKNGYTKIIYDAPLLFESGSNALCDKVVSVIALKNERINRVKQRDNMLIEDIENRINAQHSDEYYTDKSDFVIVNDSTLEELEKKTLKVIEYLEV